MRAKRPRPSALPRLEELEARLAPATGLTPLAEDPSRFTLRIDLGQHRKGGDGLPDAVFVSRAGGAVNVVLVGRQPEVLYSGDAASIDRIELVGSADVEYVLMADRLSPQLVFDAGAEDVVVQMGEPMATPDPVEEPDLSGPLPDHDPALDPGIQPAPPPESRGTPPPKPDMGRGLVFDGILFFVPKPSVPAAEATRPADDEETPSVPPELLGGGLTEEPLDVRRLTGGSHDDGRAGAWEEASAEQEPAGDEDPPEDPEPVSPAAEPT
jgi:hypothetical protein